MQTDLDRFLERDRKRVTERLDRESRIAAWHVSVHQELGIELPWFGHETWIDVNEGEYNYDTHQYELDEEKTLATLRKVVRFSLEQGASKIEKDYSGSVFYTKITIPGTEEWDDPIVIKYGAKRDLVCKKVLKEVVHHEEKTTPAYDEEVYDWECEPVSLLASTNES